MRETTTGQRFMSCGETLNSSLLRRSRRIDQPVSSLLFLLARADRFDKNRCTSIVCALFFLHSLWFFCAWSSVVQERMVNIHERIKSLRENIWICRHLVCVHYGSGDGRGIFSPSVLSFFRGSAFASSDFRGSVRAASYAAWWVSSFCMVIRWEGMASREKDRKYEPTPKEKKRKLDGRDLRPSTPAKVLFFLSFISPIFLMGKTTPWQQQTIR